MRLFAPIFVGVDDPFDHSHVAVIAEQIYREEPDMIVRIVHQACRALTAWRYFECLVTYDVGRIVLPLLGRRDTKTPDLWFGIIQREMYDLGVGVASRV